MESTSIFGSLLLVLKQIFKKQSSVRAEFWARVEERKKSGMTSSFRNMEMRLTKVEVREKQHAKAYCLVRGLRRIPQFHQASQHATVDRLCF